MYFTENFAHQKLNKTIWNQKKAARMDGSQMTVPDLFFEERCPGDSNS